MRRLSIVFVAGFLAGAVIAQAPPVNCKGKLSETWVENALSSTVPQWRVEQFVRTCGIGFEVTPAAAARLRRAGASSALIAVLREIQPKRPEPDVKREMPPATKPGTPTEKPKEAAPTPVERPKEPAAPATGSTHVNPKDGLTYVWIAPGTFTMGCSAGDDECHNFENPPHEVTITKGFWMGQTDVTVGAWKRYVKERADRCRRSRSLGIERLMRTGPRRSSP
jgi:formylglycine-generating enzyme required for sulfatase activity